MTRPALPVLHGDQQGIFGSDPIPPGRWVYVGTYPADADTTSDSPPFENGWANVGGGQQRLRFRLTNEDTLEVEGEVTDGDNGAAVTTLAALYRPDETRFTVGAGAAATSEVGSALVVWRLDPTGELVCVGGSGATGLPDPSLETDGRVLQTFGGSAIWSATIDGGHA